jgi:hypothetical protein
MLKLFLIPFMPMLKELLFDALIRVLKELAKKSDNPIDDGMVKYLEDSKVAILLAVGKVL